MRCARFMLLPALVVLLAGCGASAPLRYHSLTSAGIGPGPSGAAMMLVEVLPVAIPERLSRDDVMITGPDGQPDLRGGDRWAAPLADEIRQLLDDALWRGLRAADVYAAPPLPGTVGLPHYRLVLRLERLDAPVAGQAVAEASWTIRRLPQGAQAFCRSSAVATITGLGTSASVTAMGQASMNLAKTVANSLERLSLEAADPCSG